MKTRKPRLFALLACLFMLFANHVQAQETDGLQSFIDRVAALPVTRAAGTVTDIDLSPYTQPRTTPLYVRNGVNVRFINGTLTRAKSFTDAPLVYIQTDSRLELAPTCTLTNGNVSTQYPVVNVQNGELAINGGKIISDDYAVTSGGSDVTYIQYSGEVLGTIRNDYSAKYYIKGGIVNSVISSNDTDIWGEAEITGNVTIYKGAIALHSSLKNTLRLGYHEIGKKVLYGYDYNVTKSDVEKMEIIDNVNNYTLSLEDNAVYVREKQDEYNNLQDFIDSKAGATSVVDVDLSKFPDVVRDVPLYVRTGSSYRFINGTLSRSQTLNAPVMVISMDSKVDLGVGSVVTGNSHMVVDTACEVIRLEGGTIEITSGIAEGAVGYRQYSDNSSIYIGNPLQDPVIKLTSPKDHFYLGAGTVYGRIICDVAGADIRLDKGELRGMGLRNTEDVAMSRAKRVSPEGSRSPYISSHSDIFLNTTTSQNFYWGLFPIVIDEDETTSDTYDPYEIALYDKSVLYLKNKYTPGFIFTLYDKKDGDIVVIGDDYTITEEDVKKMSAKLYYTEGPPYLEERETYLELKNNKVHLRFKKNELPTTGCDEEWLQQKLDEIAEQRPSEPVELTICDEGITLTKAIYVKESCKAVITGGKITAASSVANNDLVFSIRQGADIRFKDITLDLSAPLPDYVEHFINNGTLTFDGTRVVANTLRVYGELRIYGYTRLPMLHLSGWGKPSIKLISAIEETWTIDSDWDRYNVEAEPYTLVSGYGYTVTKEDYSRMQFANLPDDMEVVYNDKQRVVQVQKQEKECDLQSLIDGLCDLPDDCDAPSCREIPVPEDGVDIGCADAVDPLQCAVDKVLDGGDDSVDDQGVPRRVICMCAPAPHLYFDIPSIRVNPYSTLTIRNYRFKSEKYEHQYIRVYGTLIIDVNVYIYRFIRFIHIMKGGRVIWRGGHVEDVDEIVHNEGGTLEIEGDFDNGGKRFVNPEGCRLIIRKGTFKGDIENHGTLIIEGGKVEGKVENHHEFRMEGGTVSKEIWSETDIWIKGGIQVTDIHIKRGCRIHVIGKLTVTWRIHFFVIDEFDVYVPFIIGDDGYRLTKEDFECLHIELPDGYRWIYYDGIIVIVRIVYNVVTIEEYLEYFGPQGTPENPWSIVYDKTNIDIDIDWHIKKDYHLIFDDGQFSMTGGNIYIDEGASLWLKNIKFKGEGYHIYVYGTLYIDEGVDFDNIKRFIHLCKGGQIRFVKQPTYIVNIYISEEHIVTYKPIITDIREEWLQYINIELPDGYRWIFVDGTVVIIRIPYNVMTIKELLAYFGPNGTEDSPWSFVYNITNIDIEIDWYIQKDYHLLFDGGQFSMTGGDIYLDEGASLWLKNIRFTGERHIYVNGVLIIDENVDFGDIAKFVHLLKGGKIIVKKRLISKLYMVVGEVTHGEILAINGLTESDIARLDILLPDGYTWEYNAVDGTVIVKEFPVTVIAESYTREYGEETPTFEYTSTGVALKGQPEISCEATASSPVGTYPIIIKKGSVTNQNDSYVNGTLTVTKAPLTIKAGTYTRKQGDGNPEFALEYAGFKNGETNAVLTKQPMVTCDANESSAPGEYAVRISGAEAQNYEISYVDGKLIVMDADAVVIMAKSYTREYGEENPMFKFTTEGATLDGEPVIECEATVTSAVGTYDIVIKKGSVKNYNDTYVNGTLTISKAPLKVTVKDVEREQGQENPQFEVVYEGWKLQDTESVLTKKPVATTTATKDSPVGEYTITVNGGEAQNYELTYQSGKLTVTVPSGIAELMKSGRPFDVYDAKGRKVCHQVTTLKGLKKGIYIINGKKVVVR